VKLRIATSLFCALAAAFFGAPAHAQSAIINPAYVGFGLGRDHASVPGLNTAINGVPVTASGSSNAGTSVKLYGGYQFTPNWAVEVGYTRLGNHTITATAAGASGSASYDLDAFELSALGILPVSQDFAFFGRLGATHNRMSGASVTVNGNTATVSSDSHNAIVWGVGGEWTIKPQLGLRLEYEDFGKFTGNDVWGTGGSGAIKGQMWNLNLKYNF